MDRPAMMRQRTLSGGASTNGPRQRTLSRGASTDGAPGSPKSRDPLRQFSVMSNESEDAKEGEAEGGEKSKKAFLICKLN